MSATPRLVGILEGRLVGLVLLTLLLGLLTAWRTFGGGAAEGAPQDRPPNIVFIMADDLGYQHLGAYGQTQIRTPNIDQLAAEGLRFTQVYAGSAVCAPSRSVLMTGLHMGHTPVRGNSGGIPLRDEDVTVGEVLQDAGYTTGVFGKWGLGEIGTSGVPTNQGFDDFAGFLHQIHAHFYYPEYLWKNEKKWPLPGNDVGGRPAGHPEGRSFSGDAEGQRSQYAPDEVLEHALNFVRANQDRPFFLYLSSIIPHVEVAAPEEDVAAYRGQFEEAYCSDPRAGYAGTTEPRATYAAMISHLDRNVGQILALLEALGLEENTIVFFTSDNGAQNDYCTSSEYFNASGPLRGHKTTMYEGGLRVPMIVRWPEKIAAGAVSDQPWYFADVMPTLADLAGAAPPENIDGLSVAPTLLGQGEQPQHDYLYWELQRGGHLMQAVRMGDWKGVRNSREEPVELYHLGRDVGEAEDVAALHPDVVAEIERYLREGRTEPRPQVEPVRVEGRLYR